ncbi:cholera enterotoxin subunit A2 [Beauveria bassiana ARSEF 2860]|uniref:Cholera enterotoxin subunit A2 n=1 Tax=Beauveria bassiana (strain ARSEF 2860) TaxID=655819 RepID=J4UJ62_BEAB2|nr:cholera enterotoxin subunit A2 [Beauveria bassiana ARSEF 2860]EJP63767.1 cholera enterotoxin subunit A2 [Beauveria bassiana ARSEF 2860]
MLSSFSVAVPFNQRSAENNRPDCVEKEQNDGYVVDEKPEDNGTNLDAPTPINVDTPGDKLPWVKPGSYKAVACERSKKEKFCGSQSFCMLYNFGFRPDDRYKSAHECLAAREKRPAPKVVYRGDNRAPEVFQKAGGITPTLDRPMLNESYSLKAHHEGRKLVPTAYSSTTSLFGTAFGYSLRNNKGDGWVYKIHPTPNMIDLGASNFTLEWFNEEEFSALGGIRWDQVEAWMAIPNMVTGKKITSDDPHMFREEEAFIKKFPEQKWIKNDEYNPKYDEFTTSGGQPQLAGDDFNLEKYKEKTLEQWAFDFLDKNGAPVGWTGTFPFIGPAESDPVRKI